jgi:hypothetical protein
MQLLTKAADRLLSAVVPNVTARAGCITCPPSWRTDAGCPCKKQPDGNHVQYVKTCSRTGCDCKTIECGPCQATGIGC